MIAQNQWIDALLETVSPSGPIISVKKLYNRPSDFPVHMWGAQLREDSRQIIAESNERMPACGVGIDSGLALASALGEAIERYGFTHRRPPVIPCTAPEGLTSALDELGKLPLLLTPDFPTPDAMANRLRDDSMRWVAFPPWDDPQSQDVIKVPVPLLFAAFSSPELPALTSGMATGPSLEFALLRGIYELVERDAFMISWLHRWPGRRMAEDRLLPEKVVKWIRRLRAMGVDFRLHDISTETGLYVFLGYVVGHNRGHMDSFSCGAACGMDPSDAALRAFLESALSWHGGSDLASIRNPLSDSELDNFSPSSFSDHLHIYHHARSLNAVQFLLSADPNEVCVLPSASRPISDKTEELKNVSEMLRNAGFGIYAIEVTPPELQPLGVVVVRVVIPGLVPLNCGASFPLQTPRLLEPPHISGCERQSFLNPDPHPFP